MKNIHILPTDKPSVLKQNNITKKISLVNKGIDLTAYAPINIYITSHNEDINENDYIITKDGRLVQVSYLLSKDLEEASKVILTTDVDLIKDGVQAIDDEFLEWFVKNPACEEINVVYEPKNFLDTSQGWEYTIISKIPEEVLLQSSIDGEPIWGEAIKQDAIDTLEYGLLQHIKMCLECNNESQAIRLLEKYGFEKQEEMYTEEEVELVANEMVNWAIDNVGNPNPQSGRKFDEVISKFKKK